MSQKNQTNGALSVLASIAVCASKPSITRPSSTALLISVIQAKMGHTNQTMPLLGAICNPFGKTFVSAFIAVLLWQPCHAGFSLQ